MTRRRRRAIICAGDGRPTCPVWSGRPARFGVPGRQPAENVWKDWLDYGGSDQLCMSINDDVRIFAYFFRCVVV